MVKSKPAQTAGGGKEGPARAKNNGAILIIAALDMSWRLALAVLVPIIGGYELDKHFGITPALTVTGFLVAMAGLYVILKRTLAMASNKYKNGARQ